MNKILKETKKEWKKLSFRYLAISSLILIIALIFIKINSIWIYSLNFLVILNWLCGFIVYESSNWKKKDVFENVFTGYIFIINLLFELLLGAVIYFKISNTLPVFPILTILGLGFFIISFFILFLLIKSYKSIILIIILYAFTALATIILFGFLFSTFSGLPNHGLYDLNNTKLNDLSSTLYFSSSTFYSISYGDIIPKGNILRLISQLEALAATIIHVILLGWLVSKYLKKKKK
jgi:hypothetical protein